MGTTEEVGSYAWYTAQNGFSIKQALNAYREYSKNSLQTIYPEDIKKWQDDTSASPVIIGNEDKRKEMATLLLSLIAENKLLLGTLANKEFNAPINTERMVAMPYLPTVTIEETKEKYDFCYAETEVNSTFGFSFFQGESASIDDMYESPGAGGGFFGGFASHYYNGGGSGGSSFALSKSIEIPSEELIIKHLNGTEERGYYAFNYNSPYLLPVP